MKTAIQNIIGDCIVFIRIALDEHKQEVRTLVIVAEFVALGAFAWWLFSQPRIF